MAHAPQPKGTAAGWKPCSDPRSPWQPLGVEKGPVRSSKEEGKREDPSASCQLLRGRRQRRQQRGFPLPAGQEPRPELPLHHDPLVVALLRLLHLGGAARLGADGEVPGGEADGRLQRHGASKCQGGCCLGASGVGAGLSPLNHQYQHAGQLLKQRLFTPPCSIPVAEVAFQLYGMLILRSNEVVRAELGEHPHPLIIVLEDGLQADIPIAVLTRRSTGTRELMQCPGHAPG